MTAVQRAIRGQGPIALPHPIEPHAAVGAREAFAEAEKVLLRAAERAPGYGAIQFHLGMTYLKQGRWPPPGPSCARPWR